MSDENNYTGFWEEEFHKEVVRLFNGNLPQNYSRSNTEFDSTLTPEEAAAQYFAAYVL